jgi:hypothetical protein
MLNGRCLEWRLVRRLVALDPVSVDPQPLVTREELVPAFFALYDLLEEVRIIRRLLQGDDGEEEVQEDLGQ